MFKFTIMGILSDSLVWSDSSIYEGVSLSPVHRSINMVWFLRFVKML